MKRTVLPLSVIARAALNRAVALRSKTLPESDLSGVGVCWHDGKLYFACVPKIWELTGANGIGPAEKINSFFADNRSDLAAVSIPSLILQCSEDIIAPLTVGEYLGRELPGSTLRVLKATGHCPHMSAPDETIARMREFLAQSPPN